MLIAAVSAQKDQCLLSLPSDWTSDLLLVNPENYDDTGCVLPEKPPVILERQAELIPYREQICALFSEDGYGSQHLETTKPTRNADRPPDAAALVGMSVIIYYVDYTYNELFAIQDTMFIKYGDALDLQSVELRVEYNCLVASVGPGVTRALPEECIRGCEPNDHPVYFAFLDDGMYKGLPHPRGFGQRPLGYRRMYRSQPFPL